MNGHDITKKFEISFTLGMLVLIADVINSTFLSIYFRAAHFDAETKTTSCMVMTTFSIEWILRIVLLGACVIQYKTINSPFGRHCMNKVRILALEGVWLLALIRLQIIAVVVFTIWQLILWCRRQTQR